MRFRAPAPVVSRHCIYRNQPVPHLQIIIHGLHALKLKRYFDRLTLMPRSAFHGEPRTPEVKH
jgi:hypothetical protein